MDFAKKGSTGVLVEWIKIGRKKNGLQNNYDLLSKLLVVLARFFILSAPPFRSSCLRPPRPPPRFSPCRPSAYVRSSGLLPQGSYFALSFNSKPPRLLAERSADGRSAEGACGASLSCCERSREAQLREPGQTCPQEQSHEQPPRVGARFNIYLASFRSVLLNPVIC